MSIEMSFIFMNVDFLALRLGHNHLDAFDYSDFYSIVLFWIYEIFRLEMCEFLKLFMKIIFF